MSDNKYNNAKSEAESHFLAQSMHVTEFMVHCYIPAKLFNFILEVDSVMNDRENLGKFLVAIDDIVIRHTDELYTFFDRDPQYNLSDDPREINITTSYKTVIESFRQMSFKDNKFENLTEENINHLVDLLKHLTWLRTRYDFANRKAIIEAVLFNFIMTASYDDVPLEVLFKESPTFGRLQDSLADISDSIINMVECVLNGPKKNNVGRFDGKSCNTRFISNEIVLWLLVKVVLKNIDLKTDPEFLYLIVLGDYISVATHPKDFPRVRLDRDNFKVKILKEFVGAKYPNYLPDLDLIVGHYMSEYESHMTVFNLGLSNHVHYMLEQMTRLSKTMGNKYRNISDVE